MSEIQIQDSNSAIQQLIVPNHNQDILLLIFGDDAVQPAGHRHVVLVLSGKTEGLPLGWIPVNSRLCAVRLQGSIEIQKGSCINRNLFVLSACDLTGCDAKA